MKSGSDLRLHLRRLDVGFGFWLCFKPELVLQSQGLVGHVAIRK